MNIVNAITGSLEASCAVLRYESLQFVGERRVGNESLASTAVLAHIPRDGLKSRLAPTHQLSAQSFERQTFVH